MKRLFKPANLVLLSLLVAGLGLPVSFLQAATTTPQTTKKKASSTSTRSSKTTSSRRGKTTKRASSRGQKAPTAERVSEIQDGPGERRFVFGCAERQVGRLDRGGDEKISGWAWAESFGEARCQDSCSNWGSVRRPLGLRRLRLRLEFPPRVVLRRKQSASNKFCWAVCWNGRPVLVWPPACVNHRQIDYHCRYRKVPQTDRIRVALRRKYGNSSCAACF